MSTATRSEGQRRWREREQLARCVLTHSGHRLDLREPDPAAVSLADIAHGLAWCRRFAGTGISVAEHSMLVSKRLREQGEPPDVQLAGLLHDCAEFATGDVIAPVKALIRGHKKLEQRLDAAILQALGLQPSLRSLMHGPVVKQADVWALAVETGAHDGPPIRLGMTARAAEKSFLGEYTRLTCV